jgi:hypothetical protein
MDIASSHWSSVCQLLSASSKSFVSNNRRNRRDRAGERELGRNAQRTATLVGKRIYFHEKRAEPSCFGRTILDFRVLPDDRPETPGRIVFTFKR